MPDDIDQNNGEKKYYRPYVNKSFKSGYDNSNPYNDMSAMSVGSFYKSADDLDDVMDTNRYNLLYRKIISTLLIS